MRGFVVLLLVGATLSGCVTNAPGAIVQQGGAHDALLRMRLPIHVVTVGFEDFDHDAFAAMLKEPEDVYAGIRYATTGALQFEPLQYDVEYVVHAAPEAFAEGLFAYAATVSDKAKPDGFLASYDRMGENRVCEKAPLTVPIVNVNVMQPACKDVERIDAMAVEDWIAEHRAEHGLAYAAPSQTMFVLDSYTKGYLPKDTYHQYWIDDGTRSLATKTMRAWGGEHDFVFLDVGAGPNALDFRPWANYTSEPNDLWKQEDRPIWDLAGDMDAFYKNLARNVHDGVRMLWTRTPIYPFEYADRYHLPTYIFIDPNAHANPASPLSKLDAIQYEKITDADALHKSFQDLVPWAEVTTELKFVYLDKDDAGMAAAVKDAKSRDVTGQSIDFGVIKKHVREHWDEYAPENDGVRSYPTFAFVLDAPSSGIFAYSDGDELGDSWGVFVNMADAMLCPNRPPPAHPLCFSEDLWGNEEAFAAFWQFLLTHELGHSFGLMHPHDQFSLDKEGELAVIINWLWDSTSTPMTYRHALYDFNRFDKDLVLRGNAMNMARDVLRGGAPEVAADAARRAVEAVARGDYAGAMGEAREAKRLADEQGLMAAAVQGIPGETKKINVRIAAGDPPSPFVPVGIPVVGRPPLPYAGSPFAWQEFALDLPAGATALELEYAEADAPSHRYWGAYVEVYTKDYETFVGGMWNNAYDKVVILDISDCADGCVGVLYASSGVASEYDVKVTPYV